MEVELGIKFRNTRDDVTSFKGLYITKDHTAPVYLSQENETTFILTLYLKGLSEENIDIKKSKDGTRMTISGNQSVEELRALKKVFKIPDKVVLDQIKAYIDDQKSTLTIVIPKSEVGLRGVGIEEVQEEVVVPEEKPVVAEKQEDVIEEPPKRKSKKNKLFDPIVLSGTAILVSLIVLVISFIRSKQR